MLLLRPRIGKINMQRRRALRRQQKFQKVGRLDADTARVRESAAPSLFIELLDASQQPLDADEIFAGILPRVFDEERRVAAAEFHFKRLRFGEKFRQLDSFQNGGQFVEQGGGRGWIHCLLNIFPAQAIAARRRAEAVFLLTERKKNQMDFNQRGLAEPEWSALQLARLDRRGWI